MDPEEARRLVQTRDAAQLGDRAQRLLELDELLNGSWRGPYAASLDATLVFEDVKTTWIDGFFTSTILGAHVYCRLQLMDSLYMAGRPPPGDSSYDLSELAQLASRTGLISVEEHARLLGLEDLYRLHARVPRPTPTGLILERHLAEKARALDEDPQLADARDAVRIAAGLAIRWCAGQLG